MESHALVLEFWSAAGMPTYGTKFTCARGLPQVFEGTYFKTTFVTNVFPAILFVVTPAQLKSVPEQKSDDLFQLPQL